MDNQLVKSFIQKWRNDHADSGWHESECCLMDVLDELEQMIYADEQPLDSKREMHP